jgi:hypothetical protein
LRTTRLTKRQLETLRKVARSRSRIPSNKLLAIELGVSTRLVEHYLNRFLRKSATKAIIPKLIDRSDEFKLKMMDKKTFNSIIQLCHPDKHHNSVTATKVTQWLLANKLNIVGK